ncbi:hypothetical protein H4R18_001992 [Coemansia javaensis]|uniref:Large ribosomal subunit protein mL40 n=1 Tax=Coemansia javaensis TaxID=2761396 RepID=A0A9W8HAZ9_9FUNG|nr:hypothetical protein H4R18_001992 [Coemansia javaensis]
MVVVGGRAAAAAGISARVRPGLLRAAKAAAGAKSSSSGSSGGAGTRRGANQTTADPRYEQMKQILFYQEPRTLPAASEEDVERHLAILRAEKIFKMTASARRRAEREARFAAMEAAYEALAEADPRLYEAACKKESSATFPRQMRVPTETPPTKIWDYLGAQAQQ